MTPYLILDEPHSPFGGAQFKSSNLGGRREMADVPTKPQTDRPTGRQIGERIQIEFKIEDLVNQLIRHRLDLVASCMGCKGCMAAGVATTIGNVGGR
jgi:hypothetical protein